MGGTHKARERERDREQYNKNTKQKNIDNFFLVKGR